ncbi:hypothetical protein IHE61_03270 [Streptomyces sp. GKU 257-1]|nr:hypothetical protein [Streptomyces sp. GKU 257-1]
MLRLPPGHPPRRVPRPLHPLHPSRPARPTRPVGLRSDPDLPAGPARAAGHATDRHPSRAADGSARRRPARRGCLGTAASAPPGHARPTDAARTVPGPDREGRLGRGPAGRRLAAGAAAGGGACALGLWSDDDLDDLDIGWGTRMRVALAALLRGIGGGGLGLATDGTADFGGGSVVGEVEVSGLPLLATVLWIGALAVAARVVSRRTAPAGPSAALEAALRIGALCGAGGLLLGLYAAPSYEGLELNSAPGGSPCCGRSCSPPWWRRSC